MDLLVTAPDPAHIDAVARVIDPAAFDVDSIDWLQRAVIEGPALDLLTSSDPAVHAAMLDALTRHGVLTEEWRVWFANSDAPTAPVDERTAQMFAGVDADRLERRLVTRWEVAP
jgi:hypothetical protein